MKTNQKILAASTALCLSLAGGAYAGDDNAAFLDQSGTGNTADIEQSGANNQAGRNTAAHNITQNGNNNDLAILQSDNRNQIGTFDGGDQKSPDPRRGVDQVGDGNVMSLTQRRNDNWIWGAQQFGAENTLTIDQTGHPSKDNRNNVVSNAYQNNTGTAGEGNTATINQTTPGGFQFDINAVGIFNNGGNGVDGLENSGLVQNGTNNVAEIDQDGLGNRINALRQTADGNTADVDQTGQDNRIDEIVQDSSNGASGNSVIVSLDGLNNGNGGFTSGGAADAAGTRTSSVTQTGGGNEVEYRVIEANDNQFGFRQDGDNNQAVSIEITGNNNELGVNQIGNDNSLTLGRITGNGNNVGLAQTGDTNTASLTISGNFNGGANDFGAGNAAESLASNMGMTAGLMDQDGNGNAITMDVLGDNNVFAFKQDSSSGAGNSITGTQDSTTGALGNQVAVAQVGGGNTATFSQVGSGNVASISQ